MRFPRWRNVATRACSEPACASLQVLLADRVPGQHGPEAEPVRHPMCGCGGLPGDVLCRCPVHYGAHPWPGVRFTAALPSLYLRQ
jgi:hypothetical protein